MAFAESPGVFQEMGPRFAEKIRRYYEHVREHDLFLTHALITPQTDRSQGSKDQADPFLHMGGVREIEQGLVMRGARMLATMAPLPMKSSSITCPASRPVRRLVQRPSQFPSTLKVCG